MKATSVNFINYHNPNYPEGSSAPSLLSNVTWPKYTLDSKEMFLFSDDASEEYTTIPDTYRADAIAAVTAAQQGSSGGLKRFFRVWREHVSFN